MAHYACAFNLLKNFHHPSAHNKFSAHLQRFDAGTLPNKNLTTKKEWISDYPTCKWQQLHLSLNLQNKMLESQPICRVLRWMSPMKD